MLLLPADFRTEHKTRLLVVLLILFMLPVDPTYSQQRWVRGVTLLRHVE